METELPIELTDRTAVDDATLESLETALVDEFDALLDAGSTDTVLMTEIAEAIDSVRAEHARRQEADAATAEEVAALAARIRPPAAESDPDAPAEGADPADDPEADPEGEPAPGTEAPANDDAELQPVAAGGAAPAPRAPNRAPSASGVRNHARTPNVPTRTPQISITAAADLPGHSAGARLDLGAVAVAFHEKARLLGDHMTASVATVNLPIPAANRLGKSVEGNIDIIERVTNPANLVGQNGIVAAGGWCGPLTTMWDFFAIDTAENLFDLPTVGIDRAGVSVPDFYFPQGLASQALWTWTEADDIAARANGGITNKALNTNVATLTTAENPNNLAVGDIVVVTGVDSVFNGTYTLTAVTANTFSYAKTNANVASVAATGYWANTTSEKVKPCVRIDCPTWTDYELGAEGLCVTHGNLADRSMPEYTRRFVQLVMNLHAQRVSMAVFNKVLSTASSITVTDPGSDAVGNILHAIGLQTSLYRQRFMMSENAILEAVFPLWAKEAIRSTLAMRAGIPAAAAMAVSDADIEGWFRVRKIRPQFIFGYQPLPDNAVAYPATLKFLLYVAGAFFKGDGGQINLGVQRDSYLNATNDYTAAWSEQFFLVGQRGPDPIEVTIANDVTGVTACCA